MPLLTFHQYLKENHYVSLTSHQERSKLISHLLTTAYYQNLNPQTNKQLSLINTHKYRKPIINVKRFSIWGILIAVPCMFIYGFLSLFVWLFLLCYSHDIKILKSKSLFLKFYYNDYLDEIMDLLSVNFPFIPATSQHWKHLISYTEVPTVVEPKSYKQFVAHITRFEAKNIKRYRKDKRTTAINNLLNKQSSPHAFDLNSYVESYTILALEKMGTKDDYWSNLKSTLLHAAAKENANQ